MSISIADYLKRINQKVIVCRPEDTAQAAAELLSVNRIGAMPVCDENFNLIGIISERDIVRALAKHNGDISDMRVKDLMTVDVVTARPDQNMHDAMSIMKRYSFRHLPIVEARKVQGMLSIRDSLEVNLQDARLEADVLRDISLAARAK